MTQTQVHVELFRLEDLALDYINQTTNKPYSGRSLRNWCDRIGISVYRECVNQVAADLLDHYYKSVACVKGRLAQSKAEKSFLTGFQQQIGQCNQMMQDPRFAATASQVVSPETSCEAFEAIHETNDAESADGAIVLMQGGLGQLQAQTNAAAGDFVHAVESCADQLADVVEAAPTIFINRLAQRAKTMASVPDLGSLLGLKPRQIGGRDE